MDLSRQQGRNFKLQCIPMQRVHVRQGRRWTAVASFSAALQKWLVNMRGKMIFSLDGLEVGQTNYQRFMFVASPFLMAAQWNQRRLIRGDDNEREEGTRVGGSREWIIHLSRLQLLLSALGPAASQRADGNLRDRTDLIRSRFLVSRRACDCQCCRVLHFMMQVSTH